MEKEDHFPDVIRCYFFGASFGEKDDNTARGICGFAIPDLGILYKNGHNGTIYECQYAGLMSLLKFIDGNIKSFRGFEFEIFTDAAVVAYHLTHDKLISDNLKEKYNRARSYRSKIPYRVSWIPSQENQARAGLLDAPPPNSDIEIKFDDKKSNKGNDLGMGQGWL